MRRDADEDVEIAGRGAVHPDLAFAAEANPGAVFDAGRNVDRQRLLAPDAPLAAAGFARFVDRLAGAVAGRAGALDREKPLLRPHPAMPLAGAAGGRARARLGAIALAGVAMDKGGDANRRLLAAKSVLQRNLEVVAQVAAAAWSTLGPAAGAHRAEHLFEDIGKAAGEPAGEITRAATAIFERGVAEPVVGGPLLVVLQDIVGFADVLELVLGRFVAGIAVRVVLHRELAVGPLQLIGIGRFRHPKNVVKVLLRHCRQMPGPSSR